MAPLPTSLLASGLLLLSKLSAAAAVTQPIDLGDCVDFAVIAGSTITSTDTLGTTVTGDMALSPSSEVVGFPPATLNGDQEIANDAAAAAQASLTTAYNFAAGLAFNVTLSGTGRQ
jgi:hypothetical protein